MLSCIAGKAGDRHPWPSRSPQCGEPLRRTAPYAMAGAGAARQILRAYISCRIMAPSIPLQFVT
jgi:hypothetical protein